MIHYTLLPQKDIKELKNEYHIRLFILLAFFFSCSVLIGIVSLFPAYIMSSIKEKEVNINFDSIQKDKKNRGVDATLNDLKQSNEMISIMKTDDKNSSFSNIIEKFTKVRPSLITFTSLQMTNTENDKMNVEIIVQGKAMSREALLGFKKNLELNEMISKIEFPIMDLTKNKDIPFAVKLRLKK